MCQRQLARLQNSSHIDASDGEEDALAGDIAVLALQKCVANLNSCPVPSPCEYGEYGIFGIFWQLIFVDLASFSIIRSVYAVYVKRFSRQPFANHTKTNGYPL